MRPRIRPSHLATVGVYLAIATVSVLHYSTNAHAQQLHDIYRRLYYLPIILAAFLHGFRGGLAAATVVCILYAPHATGHISIDPASTTEKSLEMLLYLTIGVVTGSLVSRFKGTRRQLECTAADLQNSLEELQHTVTQLREAEGELVRTARLAAVGRLSAGLAHEIRNPLASIQGSAELLVDDFPSTHPKHRLLTLLIEESHRLNDVLTRFLSFARHREPGQADVPILEEIQAVIGLVQTQRGPEASRISLQTTPDELPSAPAPRSAETASSARNPLPQVLGDRELLRQVLLNVLLNASQAAGPDGDVRVTCYRLADRVRIEVRDSGAGFSQQALESAFTPFFTTKEEGTGLGLAISHRIIEAHRGDIEISNAEDGGAIVSITLPVSLSEKASDQSNG
ncbi:MAG: sensor histidine kinase [Candidatus Eisenbacteria bacterium]|uniref:histidine kinase n=1 Tax=Eiseniibacteriota bacterium TaxID=2212470 RepID=A0A956NC79_UNCEI|nr:sensor histidine kinase [Candidatus Eisenbacteria bacterium]